MLDLQYPILQAPMAGVSTPEMAAAVSRAGGLGGLAVGHLQPRAAAAAIEATRALTDQAFNVNLFCHAPARQDEPREQAWLRHLTPSFARFGAEPPAGLEELYRSFVDDPAMLEVLLTQRPAVVSFHFGLPSLATIRALKQAGIVLLASATNLDEGRQAEKAGIDVLVAQGYEAGGHRGCFDPEAADLTLSTSVLTRLLVSRLSLPVVAAGGIMDAAGARAALELGAVAVQMGTAYVASPESSAAPAHRQSLLHGPGETVMTRAISGRPARCLRNLFTELPAGPPPPDYPRAYSAGKALHAAAHQTGESGFGAHWAGQSAPLARAVGAGDLTAELGQQLK
ncbi:MAG: NAD(P)H-dependent flavin oxidoreductase [Vulcanimicrobiota bacterium]